MFTNFSGLLILASVQDLVLNLNHFEDEKSDLSHSILFLIELAFGLVFMVANGHK
jgi:hypothetical protein